MRSDAHFSKLVESRSEPARDEIAELMRRYLEDPADELAVTRLEKQFRDLIADPERRAAEESAFRANGPRYLGQAWKEILSPHGHLPAPVELALWLAIVTPGYPAPRLHCPSEIAGRWEEMQPGSAVWEFARGGTFSTTEQRISRLNMVRWCVHLVARRGELQRDELWLIDGARHTYSPKRFIILECTQSRLRLLRPGGDLGDVEYQLSRITSPAS